MLRPAHARVAEFVQHMNPLHVLRGDMIMRRRESRCNPRTAASELAIDPAGRYRGFDRIRPAAPSGCASMGKMWPLSLPGDRRRVAGRGRHLRGAQHHDAPADRRAVRHSGHPVLLQEDGKLCGVCGEAEILRALAGSAGRA